MTMTDAAAQCQNPKRCNFKLVTGRQKVDRRLAMDEFCSELDVGYVSVDT